MGERQRGERIEQPERSRQAPGLQSGSGQRAEGEQIALRDEDDARDRKNDQQPDREQQVDRAGGDPVLQQREEYKRIHAVRRRRSGSRRQSGSAQWIAIQAPSFTSTSTAARSSCPLWLVGDMLYTPLTPISSCVFSNASRSATRNASVPGCPACSAAGIAFFKSSMAS